MPTNPRQKIKVGIVDDHVLFTKSLSLLISSFEQYEVILNAIHGKELQEKINAKALPDILFLDVSMPVMDGAQTAQWLSKLYPQIRLIALSMDDNDSTIIHMIKSGCCAYLLKDVQPTELHHALDEVTRVGYYNPAISYQKLLSQTEALPLQLTEHELEFLTFACSDYTYKEIAQKMNLSPRTIDGYRNILFEKLHVQSRTGMAMEAIRKGLVKL